MSQDNQQVRYGDTIIEYDLIYAPRKTVAISVKPDLRVTVTAPIRVDPEDVAARVRKRARWILRQQRELEQYLPATPPRRYISGETHRYLGRQYRLKVVEEQSEGVKLTRGTLSVCTVHRAPVMRIKELMDGWYNMQAQRVFHERMQTMLPRFTPLGIVQPDLTIKPLQARWGSCSGSDSITLNVKLMQVPKHYIDYVVVHELCHLVEHNHSKRFYVLLDRMLPDWRERRRKLNELEVF